MGPEDLIRRALTIPGPVFRCGRGSCDQTTQSSLAGTCLGCLEVKSKKNNTIRTVLYASQIRRRIEKRNFQFNKPNETIKVMMLLDIFSGGKKAEIVEYKDDRYSYWK